jgi:hypothetical protein
MMAELIEPGSILDMSESQLDALIISIRERRSRVIQARSIAHHRSRNSGVLSLRPKLEKLASRLDRAILKLDAQLQRCEGMVNQVVAMRLELGDAAPRELADELRAAGTLRVVPPNDTEGEADDNDDEVSASGVGDNERGDDDCLASQERREGR